MSKKKLCIKIDGSKLKLINHPKKSLTATASEIGVTDAYANLFPKNPKKDVLYFSAVSFTLNHINKNDCMILGEEGLQMYKSAISSPLNVEHNREEIFGFCVDSFLTNLKNNKILDEDEALEILEADGKVNIGVILGAWKINRPELAQLLEDNFDENSSFFNKAKLSFECYFSDFSFFVSNGKSDFPDGQLISSDHEDAEKMFECLRMNGGNGLWKGNRISICPHNSFIGGNALTLNPANEYSDLTARVEDDSITIQNVDDASTAIVTEIAKPTEAVEANTEAIIATSDNKPEEKSVITNIGDIVMPEPKNEDKKVEVATAAVAEVSVDKDLADALKAQLDIKLKELGAKDEAFKTLNAQMSELQNQLTANQEALAKANEMAEKMQKRLDEEIALKKDLEAKEAQRVRKEQIASRMTKVSEFVEITEENKSILEKECADASDEDFSKKLEFYKSISKKVVASEEKKDTNVTDAVKEAVTETAKDTKSVNIIATSPSETLVGKFAKAFNAKSLGFKIKD